MKFRRLMSLALVLLLASALPIQAFAEEYDLKEGSVTITTDENNQYVTQGTTINQQQTTPTVIKQTAATTTNTVTIDTSGGKAAEVTIQNVNISTASGSGIDVVGNSQAKITVQGDNTVQTGDKNLAAIHVSGGDLTLTGGQGDTLTANNTNSTSGAAAIGGNGMYKDKGGLVKDNVTGTIAVTGDGLSVTANAGSSGGGAGIGSGNAGKMEGTISITGKGTQVSASSDDGAAIGSGYNAAMSGEIKIGGEDTQITAVSTGTGASIGTGWCGDMDGTIEIGGKNVTVTTQGTTQFLGGAGIGTGYGGSIKDSGNIIITGEDNTVTANGGGKNNGGAAGIGTGQSGDVSGSITIGGTNTQVTAVGGGQAADIGAGSYFGGWGVFKDGASVTIQDTAKVTAETVGAASNDTGIHKGSFAIADTASLNDKTCGLKDTTLRVGSAQLPDHTHVVVPAEDPTYDVEGKTEGEVCAVCGEVFKEQESIAKLQRPAVPVLDSDSAAQENLPVPGALYWVLDEAGNGMAAEAEYADGTLTVTAEADTASFVAPDWGLAALAGQGVETVVFVTSAKTSSFDVAEALAAFASGKLILTHTGAEAELTLAGEAHSELLK